MKAAKYIIATDHKAGHNNKDDYFRLKATNLVDAMAETYHLTYFDDDLYCTTIYELVPGSKGKEYRPVARNYGHGGFYVSGTNNWNADHHLTRYTSKIDRDEYIEFFELHFDWAC